MPNRLAESTSPYLLQHKDNPVDWYEWGEDAFDEARSEDKPLLLSVGYSSCHWCHVMAHESFEDPDTAAEMNELFVNVKVDREERPDVDAIYMDAVQAITGHGGWPMTVFLTPDGKPFFAGTYFPKDDRHGMPSFRTIMEAVSDAWRDRRDEVERQAGSLTEAIARQMEQRDTMPGDVDLSQAYLRLRESFDSQYAGFGGAPKFPQEPVLEFLLRAVGQEWAPDAGFMVGQTLARMARGGINDHIGGGFARYSVDAEWLIPHFEKMLYNNAQLARLYLRAWQVLGIDHFRTVAVETLSYMLRDLHHPDGGLYSAEDADSEGEEGKFYVFDLDEFRRVVGDESSAAEAYFGVTETGNFEGSNHLHEAKPMSAVAEMMGIDVGEVERSIADAKRRLYERRSLRVRPGLDDKVITSWNGLALRALAEAGAVFGDERYLSAARSTARFLAEELTRSDGRLMRSWNQGKTSVPGFLDDYAALATGLFVLYQATGELNWYNQAIGLVDRMLGLFADPAGGFFTTGDDAEELITRPKDVMDNPLPSGNSMAAEALLMASLYTGEDQYRVALEGVLRSSGSLIEGYPAAVGHLLSVVLAMQTPPKELAITGPGAFDLASVAWEEFRPHVALAVDTDGSGSDGIPLLQDRFVDDRTLAYVCEGFICLAPVETKEQLRQLL